MALYKLLGPGLREGLRLRKKRNKAQFHLKPVQPGLRRRTAARSLGGGGGVVGGGGESKLMDFLTLPGANTLGIYTQPSVGNSYFNQCGFLRVAAPSQAHNL